MNGHEDHHYPCVWPECPRCYDPCTGPEEDGWVRLFAGHLCPDHRDTGHTPQRFEWEHGAPTLAMSCECGVRVEELSPTTRARCVQWWREHIRSAVNQRNELARIITAEVRHHWQITAEIEVGCNLAAAAVQRAGYVRIDPDDPETVDRIAQFIRRDERQREAEIYGREPFLPPWHEILETGREIYRKPARALLAMLVNPTTGEER